MFPPLLLSAVLLALPPGIDPALFPDVDKLPAGEIELAGLASLYQGRILHEAPHTLDDQDKGREPKLYALPRNLNYLRVFDLGKALPQIGEQLKENPALILDLRFVWADAKDAADFAGVLSQAGLEYDDVHAEGDGLPEPGKLPAPDPKDTKPAPVVLVLVNGLTAGPLETWLAAFQQKESVLLVGTPTAGQSAHYKPMPDHPGYYIIDGDLLLGPVSSSISLVGKGVQPRFLVDVTPEQSYTAYHFLDNRDDIATLLRHDATTPAPAPAKIATPALSAPIPQSVPTQEISDPVLQRAVDVVAALQVLGRLPSSSPPATLAPATTGQH
jgi:hypothetical protein